MISDFQKSSGNVMEDIQSPAIAPVLSRKRLQQWWKSTSRETLRILAMEVLILPISKEVSPVPWSTLDRKERGRKCIPVQLFDSTLNDDIFKKVVSTSSAAI
jgi:hypothetical protein